MSLMGVHIGTQIHATVPIKVLNALQCINHDIDSEINFLILKPPINNPDF